MGKKNHYPEMLIIRVSAGTKALLAKIAATHGLAPSVYARRTLERHLQRVKKEDPL